MVLTAGQLLRMATRTEDRKVPTMPAAGSPEALKDVVLGDGRRVVVPVRAQIEPEPEQWDDAPSQ